MSKNPPSPCRAHGKASSLQPRGKPLYPTHLYRKNVSNVSIPNPTYPYVPMPTILFSSSTRQAPTWVEGSLDRMADKKATPMK